MPIAGWRTMRRCSRSGGRRGRRVHPHLTPAVPPATGVAAVEGLYSVFVSPKASDALRHGELDAPPVLIAGATGYVGGRLLPALLERGVRVRCLARRPTAIPARAGLDVVEGDALDFEAVRRALAGIQVAYYLIHAMGS